MKKVVSTVLILVLAPLRLLVLHGWLRELRGKRALKVRLLFLLLLVLGVGLTDL